MKGIYVVIFVGLLFILNFSNVSAASTVKSETESSQEDIILDEQVIPLIEALKSGNREAMYDLFVFKSQEKSTDDFFNSLFAAWNERNYISAERIGEKIRDAKGKRPTGITYQYKIVTDGEAAILEFTVSDRDSKIDQILIMEEISTVPQGHFSIPIFIFTATLTIAEIVFTIYTAFVCLKRKPKFYIIWILFILICYCGIVITLKDNITLSFFVHTLEFSKISFKGNIISEISISLPLGAVLYWIQDRKKRAKYNI